MAFITKIGITYNEQKIDNILDVARHGAVSVYFVKKYDSILLHEPQYVAIVNIRQPPSIDAAVLRIATPSEYDRMVMILDEMQQKPGGTRKEKAVPTPDELTRNFYKFKEVRNHIFIGWDSGRVRYYDVSEIEVDYNNSPHVSFSGKFLKTEWQEEDRPVMERKLRIRR